MSVYRPDVVYTESMDIVHLKFVESMAPRSDKAGSEDLVIDKLKGDSVLLIRTVSGAEHSVSIERARILADDNTSTQDELMTAIYNKWVKLHFKDWNNK